VVAGLSKAEAQSSTNGLTQERRASMIIVRLASALCLVAGHAWGQSNPVLSPTGPDATAYGREQNYPYGPPAGELMRTFMVGTLTHFDRIFPYHVVAHEVAAPLLRAQQELALTYHHDGITLSLDDYLRRQPVTSLLVARDRTILYEHYQYGRTDADRFLSYSMAKTVTGMLIGIAVREGAIRSIDQPATDYVPELAGTEYGGTSIRNCFAWPRVWRFAKPMMVPTMRRNCD
jgi:CubicO group peptidase (beta-lactamase class C family)